jgi:hypothetical protein
MHLQDIPRHIKMEIGDHPRTPTSANQFKTFLTLEVSPSARLLALKKLQIVCRSRHSRMLTPIALIKVVYVI